MGGCADRPSRSAVDGASPYGATQHLGSQGLKRQFNKGALDSSLSLSIPRELLKVHTPVVGKLVFNEVWANHGLCRVDTPSEPHAAQRLVLLLTESYPVAAPLVDAAI